MIPFLKQVARHYENFEETCFVFPNRRSLVFFRKYLCENITTPVFAPKMLTINEFFYEAAGVQQTDRVQLLLELYDSYKKLNPKAEPLDEFVFWGDVILGDFNDVDKYLVDPKQLFTNISDLKAITDTFEYLTDRQRRAIENFIRHFKENQKKVTANLPVNPNAKNVKEMGRALIATVRVVSNVRHVVVPECVENVKEKVIYGARLVMAQQNAQIVKVKNMLSAADVMERGYIRLLQNTP